MRAPEEDSRPSASPVASEAPPALPNLAHASPPAQDLLASTSATPSGGSEGAADVDRSDTRSSDRADTPWIKRWRPEPTMGELGLYGGVLAPTGEHEWFSPDMSLPDQGFRQLEAAAPGFGLRAGFLPLRYFGLEAEGGINPTATRDGAGSATLYTVRGHLIGQLGLWSVTPFVVFGAGGIGVSSPRDVLGDDFDPALHWGGGVKIFINRRAMLRIDVRDVVSYKQRVDRRFTAHNPEVLFGLSVTLGRERDKKDWADETPPQSCSGDCPVESPKTVIVYVEKPNEFCHDLPPLDGIQFEHDEDRILSSSVDTLDRTVEILQEYYADTRISVIGHTDSNGDLEYNLDLSRRRAESVKRYLVDHGIEEARITTKGKGPLVPVASNDSRAGRAQNRRIEFNVSHAEATPSRQLARSSAPRVRDTVGGTR